MKVFLYLILSFSLQNFNNKSNLESNTIIDKGTSRVRCSLVMSLRMVLNYRYLPLISYICLKIKYISFVNNYVISRNISLGSKVA